MARRARGAARARTAGLTLVELLVALAILSLVAAVVAPSFVRHPTGDALTTAAADVQAMLARARQTALTRGIVVTLILDPATNRYWITAPDSLTRVTASAPSSMRPSTAAALLADSLALPPGVEIAAATPRVQYVFSPTGPAFGHPVLLRHEGRSASVALDPWTGSPHARPE